MKLKEIFDQSDTIIEPWPDFAANCFRVGGPCRSAFNQPWTHKCIRGLHKSIRIYSILDVNTLYTVFCLVRGLLLGYPFYLVFCDKKLSLILWILECCESLFREI